MSEALSGTQVRYVSVWTLPPSAGQRFGGEEIKQLKNGYIGLRGWQCQGNEGYWGCESGEQNGKMLI